MDSHNAYPTGPLFCDDTPGCQRVVQDGNSGLLWTFYTFWIVSFVFLMSFAIYRNHFNKYKHYVSGTSDVDGLGNLTKHHSYSKSKESIELDANSINTLRDLQTITKRDSIKGSEFQLEVCHSDTNDKDKEIEFFGYKDTRFGMLAYGFCLLISFVWLMLLLIVIIDYYWNCQLTGIDNMCFYGKMPIFGDEYKNSVAFFCIWCGSSTWYALWLFFSSDLRNWFRTPCSFEEAEFVWGWSESTEHVLDMNPSKPVQILRKMKSYYKKNLTLCSSKYNNGRAKTVPVICSDDNMSVKYIILDTIRYVLIDGRFQQPHISPGKTYKHFHSQLNAATDFVNGHKKEIEYQNEFQTAMTTEMALQRLCIMGPNEIPFKRKTVSGLLYHEFFTWFYFYQWIMYVIWYWFSYLFVAVIETIVVLTAAFSNIYVTWYNEKTIAKLSEFNLAVEVLRDGMWQKISSKEIVIGDLIKVDNNWDTPCDIVLLQGNAVCNESSLTGESMPIQKISCSPDKDGKEFDSKKESGRKHTLYAGTTVLQARAPLATNSSIIANKVIGIVIATGTNTSKGDLVSTILFPQKVLFKYDEELFIVVILLLCYGCFCFTISIIFQHWSGIAGNWVTKWCYGMFSLSQVLTPLLPVALKVGQIQSCERLKKVNVLTIDPARIAICGKMKLICFDKTGTLTKDGLDFLGVQPVYKGKDFVVFDEFKSGDKNLEMSVERGLATCHNVTKYGESFVGNEVEVRMFESTRWLLDESNRLPTVMHPSDQSQKLKILKRFQFDHARQTMSVIVKDLTDDSIHIYCKGSFEKIRNVCNKTSLPENFNDVAKNHAMNGMYVLAIAHAQIDSKYSNNDDVLDSMTRDQIENGLDLMGLVLFRNELKHDTKQAIRELKNGGVKSIIITGDNAQCGLYIAKASGMVLPNVPVILGTFEKKSQQILWTPMEYQKISNGNMKTDTGSLSSRTSVQSSNTTARPNMTTKQLVERYPQLLSSQKITISNSTNGNVNEWPIELAISGNETLEYLSNVQIGNSNYSLFKNNTPLDTFKNHIRLYARLSPDSKVAVVETYRNSGVILGMVGDGGNDCGALRAAHAGLSLSDTEASLVSHFTSKSKSCMSAVDLVKEGRAALHTSFSVYKFLLVYGQFFSVTKMVTFYYGVLMSNAAYMAIDVIAILTLGYTMTLGMPRKNELPKTRPTSSLLSPTTVASVIGMQAVNITFLTINLFIMTAHKDYVRWPSHLADSFRWWFISDNWESTVMYFSIYMNFISCALIFSFGSDFRRCVFRNWRLVLNFLILYIATALLFVIDPNEYTSWWHIASYAYNNEHTNNPVWQQWQKLGNPTTPGMPFNLRLVFYLNTVICFALMTLWQGIVIEGPISRLIKKKYPSKRPTLIEYYERDFENNDKKSNDKKFDDYTTTRISEGLSAVYV